VVTAVRESITVCRREADAGSGAGRPLRPGVLMARAYAGAWRPSPPPLDLALEEVAAIHSQLLTMGGAGLVWPRLRERANELGAVGMALEYGYQQTVASNAGAPARIAEAVSLLQRAGIEPVLLKGWSVSRHYPFPAVRLSGDIDLIVRPAEVSRAEEVLRAARSEGVVFHVDLHDERTWTDLPYRDFRDRLDTIDVAGCEVRVPCAEDQLHILCHHFIRHAAFRPLWLCDIALTLETRAADFDWDRFLGREERRSGWVVTALALAHHVLGARVDDAPIEEAVGRMPCWLIPTLLRRWELTELSSQSIMAEVGSRKVLSTLTRHRWPDPVGATVYLRMPFNDVPRLPLQWAAFLIRSATYGVPMLVRDAASRLLARVPTPNRGSWWHSG
jgi:hypothetical protein